MAPTRGSYTHADLQARLRTFESQHRMSSEDFFTRWERGDLPRTDAYFAWAGLCSQLGVKELDPA